jgi:hypothetical protein
MGPRFRQRSLLTRGLGSACNDLVDQQRAVGRKPGSARILQLKPLVANRWHPKLNAGWLEPICGAAVSHCNRSSPFGSCPWPRNFLPSEYRVAPPEASGTALSRDDVGFKSIAARSL